MAQLEDPTKGALVLGVPADRIVKVADVDSHGFSAKPPAKEALVDNALVVAWPEISRLASAVTSTAAEPAQERLL